MWWGGVCLHVQFWDEPSFGITRVNHHLHCLMTPWPSYDPANWGRSLALPILSMPKSDFRLGAGTNQPLVMMQLSLVTIFYCGLWPFFSFLVLSNYSLPFGSLFQTFILFFSPIYFYLWFYCLILVLLFLFLFISLFFLSFLIYPHFFTISPYSFSLS